MRGKGHMKQRTLSAFFHLIPAVVCVAMGCDGPVAPPPPAGVAGTITPPPPPSTFQLTGPASGTVGEILTPTLTWTDATDETSYTLEIATDSAFTTLAYQTNLPADTTQFTVPAGALSPNTVYYWRVTANNPGPPSPASNGPFSFRVSAWMRSYGSSGADDASAVDTAADGGYVVTERTASFGVAQSDVWILKLSRTGSIDWQKAYGGATTDRAFSIRRTSDGGYVAAGVTNSFGAGNYDFWVIKLNGDGTIAWQKTYGGLSVDTGQAIVQTTDGGYLLGGHTTSFGAGVEDMWVLKLNADGTVAWQKTYGGAASDYLYTLSQTSDGGYVLAGRTASFGSGSFDFWILKLNADGTVAWQKAYGGAMIEYARAIREVSAGGYIVAGYTNSFGAGGYDYWVVRLNADGTVAWQKTHGGASNDQAFGVEETSDGRFVVTGHTISFGAGLNDAWVLKLNADGTVAWQRTFGGLGNDFSTAIREAPTGELAAVGRTDSFTSGSTDIWVLRLNPDGSAPPMGTDTVAAPSDTAVVPVDTAVAGSDTVVIPGNTAVVPTDTAAVIKIQAP